MDRIAAAAGVSKERIYGHFNNKDGLFAAVLEDALDDILTVVTLPDDEQADTGSLLREYVDQVSRYHRSHPEFLRLLLWEALERPYPTEPTSGRAARYREKVEQFAQRLGIPHDQAAPLLFGVIGLAAWPQVLPQLAAYIIGLENSREVVEERALDWARSVAEKVDPKA